MESIGTLAGGIAHDFNSIGIIVGLASQLDDMPAHRLNFIEEIKRMVLRGKLSPSDFNFRPKRRSFAAECE